MTTTGPQILDRPTDDQAPKPRPVSRRTILTGVAGSVAVAACADLGPLDPSVIGGGGGGAGGGSSETPTAAPTATPIATPTPTMSPAPAPGGGPVEPVLADDEVLHLLRRATFGPTNEMVAQVQETGVAAWLDEQLAPDDIDDSACMQRLARFPMLDRSAAEINATPNEEGGSTQADRDLIEATVVRALCTQRQLHEVMVEFWSNHFSVYTPSEDDWGRRTVADREVYRPHALGRFADLLVASAKDPAMLRYLNNEQSCFTGDPNTVQENYGRELLELHTVGVDAGYTEEDVKNSAYILSGWTVDDARQFRFDPGCHYVGPVQVLDFSDPNGSAEGGLAVGEAYLDHLAHHASTASFLATKLARRFVADEPSAALIESLAAVFVENDTQIEPVLRALFGSDEFAGSYGQKTRRPLEDVVASARALGLTPRTEPSGDRPRSLVDVAYDLGQAPMNWGPPNGYPDVAGPWLSSARLLGAWNYHWDLLEGRYDEWLDEVGPALESLVDLGGVGTVGALVDALVTRLLWQEIRAEDRQVMIEFTGLTEDDAVDGAQLADLRARIALAILNSPYHLQR